jgi:hypothetical protein
MFFRLSVNHRLQTSASPSLSPYTPHPCLFYPHTIRKTCVLSLDSWLSPLTQPFNLRSNSKSLLSYIPFSLSKTILFNLDLLLHLPEVSCYLVFPPYSRQTSTHAFLHSGISPALTLKTTSGFRSCSCCRVFLTSQNPFFCAGYVYFLDAQGTTLAAIFDGALEWRQ